MCAGGGRRVTPDWSPLDRALESWGDAPLPLWWRDDDAVEPTPALERLGEMSQSTGLPVHLAIIPAGATRALGERIAGDDRFLPLVHGWVHENHEHEGKKSEFGVARPLEVRQGQAAQAFVRLEQALGHPPLPVFVPPWNRIADDMAPALAGAGYRALSTFTPREAPMAAEGLHRINTHLDPIDWRRSRGFPYFIYLGEQLSRYSNVFLSGARECEMTLLEKAVQQMKEVVEDHAPFFCDEDVTLYDGRRVLLRSVILPLADDGEHVSHILGAANGRFVYNIG